MANNLNFNSVDLNKRLQKTSYLLFDNKNSKLPRKIDLKTFIEELYRLNLILKELTDEELAAVNAANSPSNTNPFATINDIISSTFSIPVVLNYSALPDPATVDQKYYRTTAGENASWRPQWLGGTYYPEGIYQSVGGVWDYVGEFPFQADQATVNAGTNNTEFITPKTLTDSAQLLSKANVSGQVFTGDISAPKVNVLTPAISGSEILGTYTVTDSNASLSVVNISTTNGLFTPGIVFEQPTSLSTAGYILIRGVDSGTSPMFVFDARANGDIALTTRPIFRLRNLSTQIIDVTATGSIGINTTAPTERFDVNGNGRIRGTLIFGDTDKSISGGAGAVMNINSGVNSMIFRGTSTAFMRGTQSSGVGIEIAASNPTIDNSAILTLTSTSKGFLPPRMTTAERDAIVSPATGLVIYNTTVNSLQLYNGSNWSTLGIVNSYSEKSANYTITNEDNTINCTANTFTVTLPTAVGITGKKYTITNTGSGIITLATTSSQTIQGELTQLIYKNETFDVMSTGSNWIVI